MAIYRTPEWLRIQLASVRMRQAEAAEFLGVSSRTLIRWCKDYTIPLGMAKALQAEIDKRKAEQAKRNLWKD